MELRLRIVTELYAREMSPKQFHEEFGGGSLPRVIRSFNKLAEHGWLSLTRTEGPGGKRHGAVEHFYRATELAFCDQETWALMPYSIRVAFSWNSFKEIAARLRKAMEAEAFDPSRNLTFTTLRLDQLGWEQVIEAISTQFELLFEEQTNARLRMCHSDEQPIRASVIQIAFEAPMGERRKPESGLLESRDLTTVAFPVRLSKVFADELCMQIIEEANRRAISAPQFHEELGGDSLEQIRRRFKKLEKFGWLKPVEKKTGGRNRNAVEWFYRAVGPAIPHDDGPWAGVSDALKNTTGWKSFEQLSAQVKEAMRAGTFDARDNSCLAWSIIQLDQQGWEKVTAELDAVLAFVLEEQDRARARMKKSPGEMPIATTVALGAFESSKEAERES